MRPPPVNLISDELERDIRRARVVTPSKASTDFWYGGWANDQEFSWQQIRELRKLLIDVDRAERMTVYVACSDMVVRNTLDRHAPYRAISCPIVGRRGEKLLVIAPNGHNKFVCADGYVTAPSARKWGRAA